MPFSNMYTVRYDCNGRLGNCVFPYILCVVFEMLFDRKYVTTPQPDEFFINDHTFKQIYNEENFKNKRFFLPNANICFTGYFQYDYIITTFYKEVLDYIKNHPQSLFSPHNLREFSNEILYKNYLPDFTPKSNDIAFHLRFEDALAPSSYHTPLLLKLYEYKNVIQKFCATFSISPGTIYWVMNKPTMPLEFTMLKFLLTEIGGVYKPQTMEEDMCLMRRAPNLICSHSTFSWIAAAFREGEQNSFVPETNPYLNDHITHEKFLHIHDKCVIYEYDRYNGKALDAELLQWRHKHNIPELKCLEDVYA